MTAANVIDRAREILADTVATYRWPDSAMFRWVTDGEKEIAVRRPDALIKSDGTLTVLAVRTATSDTLGYDEQWAAGLVDYVCWRAFSTDAEHAGMGKRSLFHRAAFERALR